MGALIKHGLPRRVRVRRSRASAHYNRPMRCLHTLAACALIAISSAPAHADYTEVSPVRPLTMIDPSGLTVIGIDFQLTKWTVDPPGAAPRATDFTTIDFALAADLRIAPHW